LLCAAAVAQSLLSAYDVWLYDTDSQSERIFLAHYTVPLYLLVVGLILIRHFVASMRGFEQLNMHLERRVEEKSNELSGNYDRLVEAKKAETLATERSRIMSEMHDGIGSQLTTALALVRKLDRDSHPDGEPLDGPIARVLKESIEDLQLIVDSLEPVEHDLSTVLGTLRYRLQGRLSEAGIELSWRVSDLPPLPVLTPHSVLSILRIVQEAFANALKHSGAKRIEVATGLLGDPGYHEVAFVRVVDDGCGMGDVGQAGRGLNNMRQRARSLDGSLSIESNPGRTEVLLAFPTLRKAAA
jgi:signal transduction histidine kinase